MRASSYWLILLVFCLISQWMKQTEHKSFSAFHWAKDVIINMKETQISAEVRTLNLNHVRVTRLGLSAPT